MEDSKSFEEKVHNAQKKKHQLERQANSIIKRENQKERRERTRRLIQFGALTEKYLGIHDIEKLEKFLYQNIGYIKPILDKFQQFDTSDN